MKTGITGLKMIESFEGLRLSSYTDSVGIWTIGYGSTFLNYATGERVYPGLVITQSQAEQMLSDGLVTTESYINAVVKVAISQNMFDALVCLVYNIGQGNFAKSSVLSLLNQGDYSSAADAFLLWNRAGGIIQPGLMRRRQTERALFLQGIADLQALPVPPTPPAVVPPETVPDTTGDTSTDVTTDTTTTDSTTTTDAPTDTAAA